MSVVSRVRWGHALVDRSHRGDSWWWFAWSFVIGAPLTTAPGVVGSGSAVRALARLAGAAAVAGAACVYASSSPESMVGLAWWSWAAAALAVGVVGWRLAGWAREWRHRRRWVRPLEIALRPQLGYPPNMPAWCWLSVPRELAEDRDGVRVFLPAAFVGRLRERQLIEATVIAKLGLGDVNVAWRLVSRSHVVHFTAKARPPARALFREPAVATRSRGRSRPAR